MRYGKETLMLDLVVCLISFLYCFSACSAELLSMQPGNKSILLDLSSTDEASGTFQDPEERIFARVTKFPKAGLLRQYDESGEHRKSGLMGVSNISPTFRVFSWATKVVRFSSQFLSCESNCSSSSQPACTCEQEAWAASQILGPPDVFPDYARSELAWTPSLENKGDEFIELEFPFEMYIEAVEIYETFNPGAVRSISTSSNYTDLLLRCQQADISECSESLKWQQLWTKSDDANSSLSVERANIFSPTLCPNKQKTKVIRIDLDTSNSPGWNALDAVKIVGTIEYPSGLVTDDQNRLVYSIRDGIHGEDEVLVNYSDCSAQLGERLVKLNIEPPQSGNFSSNVFHEEDIFLMATGVTIDLSSAINEINQVLGNDKVNSLGGLLWHTDMADVALKSEFLDVSVLEPEINFSANVNRTSKVELWLTESFTHLTFRVHYNLIPCNNGETTSDFTMGFQSRTERELCILKEDKLLPSELIALGYAVTGVSWFLSISFLFWVCVNRRENSLRCSQIEFLFLICMGTIISSSTLIALSFEAESESEIIGASIACKAAPFLYSIGWVLQYSSICTKSWRIYKVMRSFKSENAVRFPFCSALPYVLIALGVDLVVLVMLTISNPLEYTREQSGYNIDSDSRMVTVEYVGKCMINKETPSFWTFAGPLIGFHAFLLFLTNTLLLKVRNMKEIYQESQHLAMAMGLVFEFLIVSLPVFVALQDSSIIKYTLCIVFIGVHDISILCFIFVPKVIVQRRGARHKNDIEESFIIHAFQIGPGSNGRDKKADLHTLVVNEESAPTHIPAHLGNIIMSKKTSKTTVRFVLKEFGGVDDDDGMGTIKNSGKHSVGMSDEDENLYILPEFQRADKKIQLREMLSWTSLKRWDFNVFELTKLGGGKNPLLFLSWAIICSPYSQYSMAKACGMEDVTIDDFRGYEFIKSDLNIPIKTLCDYFRVIENDYNSDIPFHNEIHGADVLQSLHVLLQMTHGILQTTKEQLFSVLLAAVIHDVNHPGRNNAFQINARTRLALLYNDCSVLEHRHLSHAFRRMLGMHTDGSDTRVRNDDLNFLRNLPLKRFLAIRTRMIDCVLKTDMSKHFETVKMVQRLLDARKGDEIFSEEDSWLILQYVLHVADISNAAKGESLFKLWTERCLNEFFDQGDVEADMGLPISPNCDRKTTDASDCQVGFIHFILVPSFKILGEIIPRVEKQINPILRKNLEYWKRLQDPTLDLKPKPESVSSDDSFDADSWNDDESHSVSLSESSMERFV